MCAAEAEQPPAIQPGAASRRRRPWRETRAQLRAPQRRWRPGRLADWRGGPRPTLDGNRELLDHCTHSARAGVGRLAAAGVRQRPSISRTNSSCAGSPAAVWRVGAAQRGCVREKNRRTCAAGHLRRLAGPGRARGAQRQRQPRRETARMTDASQQVPASTHLVPRTAGAAIVVCLILRPCDCDTSCWLSAAAPLSGDGGITSASMPGGSCGGVWQSARSAALALALFQQQ